MKMTPAPAGADGLEKRPGATYLDHVIHTFVSGEACDSFTPIWSSLVVDDRVRPELPSALELFIAARRDDNFCSSQFCDLEAENGYAAGSKEKNGLTGKKLAPDNQ